MALSDEDVREILRIIDESSLDELRIETDGFSLHVRKGSAEGDALARPLPTPRGAGEGPPPRDHAPDRPGPEPAGPAGSAGSADRTATIDAPMLGTFYRAQGPGSPPFVEVGDQLQPDTIVCIIEVMKMMNSVPAGVSGVVIEVCSENAQLVEYGEPLFRVRAAG
jgi:acetyl-CoA carboxylase biotin carboxyl carrier protein